MVLLHIPAIQTFMGSQAGSFLSKKLGTAVSVGRINLGFFNRIVIDDITIYDQQQQKMLHASRLAGKIDVLPLVFDGKVRVSSTQLFGLEADFYKKTATAKPNFQFALDSLASKDTLSHTPLDIQIQSLVIRHGKVRYNQWDAPKTPHQFNLKHLDLTELSTHINLYTLTDDSLAVKVKKMAFKEKSGLDIHSLTCQIHAGKNRSQLSNFVLQLPATHINIPNATVSYKMKNKQIEKKSVSYVASLNESTITPCDVACFLPNLKHFRNSLSLRSDLHGTASALHLDLLRITSSTGSITLNGSGMISNWDTTPLWKIQLDETKLSADGLQYVAKNFNGTKIRIPQEIMRLGNIRVKGYAQGKGRTISSRGNIQTDAGNVQLQLSLTSNQFSGNIQTDGINLSRILNDNHYGQVVADIKAEGRLKAYGQHNQKKLPVDQLTLKGNIGRFDYKGYSYRNLTVDGSLNNHTIGGLLTMDDPNGKVELNGSVNFSKQAPTVHLTGSVRNFNAQALQLTNALGNRILDFDAKADFTGNSLAHANGYLHLENVQSVDAKHRLYFNNIDLSTGYQDNEHFVSLESDFGNILIRGNYNYKTLTQSFINVIADKLPSVPGLPPASKGLSNDFAVIANIYDASLVQSLFGTPLQLHEPLHIKGALNDNDHQVNIDIDAPGLTYDGMHFTNSHIYLFTRGESLYSNATVNYVAENGRKTTLDLEGYAANNKLTTTMNWKIPGTKPLRGLLKAESEFYVNENGKDAAHIHILPSEVFLDDTRLEVKPADIYYSKKDLYVDHFQISNNNQHIIISGKATDNPDDAMYADLQDIDVANVLELINFHSIDFAGFASGRATLKNVFGTLDAEARLDVKDFRFENGRMGILHAYADYNTSEGNINIDAVTDDEPYGTTLIKGYISPVRNNIDLHIQAQGTRLEFVENYCSSFLDNVNAKGNGHCRVFGDLKHVNIEGGIVADGDLHIKTLNTTYTLRNDTIVMVPNEIIFHRDSIYDREGHLGIVTGALHHKELKQMTFDINVEGNNLLAYDFHDYGDQIFYGTVYGTGNCYIKGRKGEISFNIEATLNKESFIEYNAASPEGISKGDFIHWEQMTPEITSVESRGTSSYSWRKTVSRPSDIRINFLVNTTPDFTLRLLMDENTGDMISLNGNGVLRATYFNKGGLEMFGNYLIDYGTYTMTVQNVIKKVFTFQPGSTIVFGGDPFNATLNMKGQYTVPAVSLSDLQMGNSFTNNNIRVNCLMNIGGTAGDPKVTFDLDMPTLSTDAQQMIRSVINSEEDMNQQVIYLLAVGRFMPQTTNNATTENPAQPNQTTLAMQSLLSGTLSQQINTVLSNVVKSSNWNFGAHISPGNEGFNNAEYEGLLSGRLLNNRLLINGEFGYRDNVKSQQSSFIGDFDVQYLLFPNGNLSVKVYNKTNDRYFTRNSLTTQGIGILMKKDFTTLKDLFGREKKKKKKMKPSAKK